MESSVKKKIEYFCAYQERCHLEVSKKLNKLGVFGDDADEYVCYLIDENFLSETRFSEAYVRGKFNNNNWGKIKIIRELKSRNISNWNISNALNQISDIDYNNKLKKLCEKQIELSDKTKVEMRNKVIKSLSIKGWEIDLIITQINQLIK
ncbi:MAG: RecX family transcriptional regulator [Flavobacteriaceae bacterium]|jgi:regulatory protein|nr:RecX family transcriptional regulator [Flavobacteriaceae bacterium]|tara:strand:- start:803 stop:1252 length:450 start_codon:yes stop_codon:yes gene_type:complete